MSTHKQLDVSHDSVLLIERERSTNIQTAITTIWMRPILWRNDEDSQTTRCVTRLGSPDRKGTKYQLSDRKYSHLDALEVEWCPLDALHPAALIVHVDGRSWANESSRTNGAVRVRHPASKPLNFLGSFLNLLRSFRGLH